MGPTRGTDTHQNSKVSLMEILNCRGRTSPNWRSVSGWSEKLKWGNTCGGNLLTDLVIDLQSEGWIRRGHSQEVQCGHQMQQLSSLVKVLSYQVSQVTSHTLSCLTSRHTDSHRWVPVPSPRSSPPACWSSSRSRWACWSCWPASTSAIKSTRWSAGPAAVEENQTRTRTVLSAGTIRQSSSLSWCSV